MCVCVCLGGCVSHHAYYGLQQLVTRHVHPGQLYGIRVPRGTGGQEVIYHKLSVATWRTMHLQRNKVTENRITYSTHNSTQHVRAVWYDDIYIGAREKNVHLSFLSLFDFSVVINIILTLHDVWIICSMSKGSDEEKTLNGWKIP